VQLLLPELHPQPASWPDWRVAGREAMTAERKKLILHWVTLPLVLVAFLLMFVGFMGDALLAGAKAICGDE